jgi:hypothetical protein
MAMEAAGPQGPDSGGGIMAAIILWGVVSLICFIVNAGLAIGAIVRGRSAMKPLMAFALPIFCIVLPLVFGALLRAVIGFRPAVVAAFSRLSGTRNECEGLAATTKPLA